MIGFVILSLFNPSDREDSEGKLLSFTDTVTTMGEVIHYMTGICIEKPTVCIKGREILESLGVKAADGAQVAYALFFNEPEALIKPAANSEPTKSEPVLANQVNAEKNTPASITVKPIQPVQIPLAQIAVATDKAAERADHSQMNIPIPIKRPAMN